MHWRLLLDGAADGAVNMAVDEALHESAMAPGASPALRLYRFQSPTLTFGYGQRLDEAVHHTECQRRSIDCIRRITGGRALLHHQDLTFAVAAPPLAPTVKGAYRRVTSAIARALERLRVPIDRTPVSSPGRAPRHLPCLAVPTGHEITVGGRKVVASAMRYRRQGFLVHGSILWSIDRASWEAVTPIRGSDPLPAVGLAEVAPELSEAALVEALVSSFAELFGSRPAPSALTVEEAARTSELTSKYRSPEWTRDRRDATFPIG